MNAPQLLHRLLPSPDIDALLGDITEEARDRSRLWYWAQVGAVLFVGWWHDVRRHPFVALRAIGIGVAALLVLAVPALILLRVVRVLSDGGYYIGPYWLTLPSNAFRWLPSLVNTLVFAASGWTIVRFHRSHGIAMLMPFVVLTSVFPAIGTRRSGKEPRAVEHPDGTANRRHRLVAFAPGVRIARRPPWALPGGRGTSKAAVTSRYWIDSVTTRP